MNNYNSSLITPSDSYALIRRNAVALNSVQRPNLVLNPYQNYPRVPSSRNRNQRRRRANLRNALVNNLPYSIPRSVSNRGRIFTRNSTRLNNQRINQINNSGMFGNGGMYAPSVAISTNTRAPVALGFSLSNSGEKNVTFSKEFVAGFLTINAQTDGFNSFELTTHPSLNASVVAIAQIYQRYKILSYHFKYKASCPTTATGLHYTGVDYGNQIQIPANFQEAESLEHFSVGPIWRDSQDWHQLKISNLKERWFDIGINDNTPDSRPARIIYGSLGVNAKASTSSYGLIEVRVTYLFNGLAQMFTGQPKSGESPADDQDSQMEIVEKPQE